MAPNSKLNAKRKAQRESTKQPGKPRAERRPNEDSKAQYIPIELQQLLLNIFRNSFAEHLSSDFAPLLQEVKGHLYNRDFATAFGKNEYLEVMEISAVDIADWNVVVENLAQHLTTTPVLSKYASAAAKAANVPFANPEDISITFHQHDVLQASTPAINSQLAEASLVTLLFTLNELYTTSLPLTQKFLLHVTSVLQSGALLLVVDSPGSYSSVTLNGAEKKYPMQWLLDHTLLNQASSNKNERGKEEIASWEKITEDDSRWFRLDDRLQYPIELENMRMQMHLYRKL
ncbi:Methyltransf_34 domain containing protein [Pyrenophora tritici-repentis]|nr:Methyltransf_34 domain containing protein [Pyrenophora tritici-repentis]